MRIDRLGDGGIARAHVGRRFRLEARVGTHPVEHLRQRARPADPRRLRLHLRGVARHFLQPQRMHLRRRHRQRRALLDAIGVIGGTAWHRRQAHRVARVRQIVVGEEVPDPAVRGLDYVADLRGIGGGQSRPIRRRDRGGEHRHRLIEDRTLDALRE